MAASISASSRLGNTRKSPASTSSNRSAIVVRRSAQPCAAAASAAIQLISRVDVIDEKTYKPGLGAYDRSKQE